MEAIYQEMKTRNTTWLKDNLFISDPSLINPEKDTRRCIAIVTEGTWTKGTDYPLLETFIQNNVATKKWIQPSLHHTFICLRPWGTQGDYETPQDLADFQTIAQTYLPTIKPYTIHFDQIIPVQTGFVLCGIPTININHIRDSLRTQGLVKGERYHLDICHATLLRNTQPLSKLEQINLLSNPLLHPHHPTNKKSYLTLTVTHLHLCEASWLMHETGYKRYHTIKLQ